MKQRLVAAVVAVPLLLALFAVAAFAPLPFATYGPGLTVDVLGKEDGKEIVQVSGHRSFHDDGELRMTTVYVSLPGSDKSLLELIGTWLDPDRAVYPYDAVYEKDETAEESRIAGAIDMVTSQDVAVAVALEELGYEVEPAVMAAYVAPDSPAEGRIKVKDLFVSVNGTKVSTPEELVDAVRATPRGEKVRLRILRDGTPRTVALTPDIVDGEPRIGVSAGTGFRFPFQVSVSVDPDIGGPSAGLMFALGIYDTLTPGSLTGGRDVAGSGTIARDGTVGPIGGIQQKIAAARRDGAELFLVPSDNCPEALGAENGDMRLVRARTMHEARVAVETWAADPDAELPSCEG
ncbi:YlbL family protein [Nocardioides ochotonae]|uniref:YlbL family protein n=1 Tax=Nocardioides ochotonae TaxID=2685869 RepID=UPI00140B9460|nr:PDZ domain-containing protein [Nocardioides ochotonae]